MLFTQSRTPRGIRRCGTVCIHPPKNRNGSLQTTMSNAIIFRIEILNVGPFILYKGGDLSDEQKANYASEKNELYFRTELTELYCYMIPQYFSSIPRTT